MQWLKKNALLTVAALAIIALVAWEYWHWGYKEGWNAKGEEIDRILNGVKLQDWNDIKPVPPEE